jgi:hypothetical protein
MEKILVDIGLIAEIEEALCMGDAPPPDVVAPLAARIEAHRAAFGNPYLDEELQEDIRRVLQPQFGCFLELWEIHAMQRLRGWHRARFGTVEADARWLAEVRDVLYRLWHELSDECEQEVEHYGLDRVSPAATRKLADREYPSFREARSSVLASMTAGWRRWQCGECKSCWVISLHERCATILDHSGDRRAVPLNLPESAGR